MEEVHITKWKMPTWKGYILYDYNYATFRKRQDYEDSQKSSGFYKCNLIEPSSFCTARETLKKKKKIKKKKTIYRVGENLYKWWNDATNKGLTPKYTNNSYNSTAKMQTTQMKNGQKT